MREGTAVEHHADLAPGHVRAAHEAGFDHIQVHHQRIRAGTSADLGDGHAQEDAALAMKPRVIHRAGVVVAALPLLITSATGSIYSLLLEQGVDAFWLLKIHTGRFGVVNLQPYYSWLLGVLTLLAIGSGILLLVYKPRRSFKS